MKKAQDELEEAKKIVDNSSMFEDIDNTIELNGFTRHWSNFINGELTPDIKAVVWEDKNNGQYKVQIPSKKVGSFELVTRQLRQDKSMVFVHSNGFLAVAKDKETMVRYLEDELEI